MVTTVKTSKPAKSKPAPRKAKSRPFTAQANAPAEPSPLAIAERAYHLYLQRIQHSGSDFDDWLRAERELRETSRPS